MLTLKAMLSLLGRVGAAGLNKARSVPFHPAGDLVDHRGVGDLMTGASTVPVVHGIGPRCPPENSIYMHLHTYVTELALAAEPSRLPGWHVNYAGVVDDRTRDG
jgi:hypothetical protein